MHTSICKRCEVSIIKSIEHHNTTQETAGLTGQQFAILKNLIIDPLKQRGAKVWVFGSRSRGNHRPTSDVDLLFEMPNDQQLANGFLFSIKSDLEESRFPFTLDLVQVNELAESYREQVFKERKSI